MIVEEIVSNSAHIWQLIKCCTTKQTENDEEHYIRKRDMMDESQNDQRLDTLLGF